MKQSITLNSYKVSPCKGCAERFYACHSCCPKDKRNEYGYKAWKLELEDENKKRKEYKNFTWRY